MTWLCALKWGAIGLGVGSWSVFLGMVSYSLGWRRATKQYWSMLHNAGSRFGN